MSRTTLLLAMALAGAGCARNAPDYVVAREPSPDGRFVAEVRLARCGTGWCQSLWAGAPDGSLVRCADLQEGAERSDEIAWLGNGTRVGFLVNGTRLRLCDPQTGAPAGLVDLVPADGPPSTRVARGVTFSENGAAITFDDCPRGRSGCRPGLVALR